MYDLSTSTAAIATGATVVLSGVSGQVVGGLWISWKNPTVRKQLIFGVSCLAISWLFALHPLYKCEETTLIGSNLSFDNLRSNSTQYDIEAFDRQRWANAVRAGPSELGPGIDPDLTVFLVRSVLNDFGS